MMGLSLLVGVYTALAGATHVHHVPYAARVAMRQDSLTSVVCVVDAVTGRVLSGAVVEPLHSVGSPRASSNRHVTTTAHGRTQRVGRDACLRLPIGDVQVRRIGYLSRTMSVRASTAVDTITLSPVFADARTIDTVRVRDTRDGTTLGRMTAVVSVDEAQRAGVATTAQLVARLPFANVRDARGEHAIQLRGARSEQVVVLLDGMVMNDPATGRASVNDLPLSTLDAASATLGANPMSGGPGALGGVIALTSAARRTATMRVGTLGESRVEGAWAGSGLGAQWNMAAGHHRSANNFRFVNTAAPTPIAEQRVNNDETGSMLSLGAIGDRWQVRSIVARNERGMVGPMNVRSYDADRARSGRALMRGQVALGSRGMLVGSLRHFSLAYRDPARAALNATARVWAGDVETTGELPQLFGAQHDHLSAVWRAGAGTDQLRTSGGVRQGRTRGFGAAQLAARTARSTADVGFRLDVVDGVGQPSLSAAADRRLRAAWFVSARVAQAFRAPTLYDLYFSSPQRLAVRPLDPERVSSDLELNTHTTHRTAFGMLRAQASVSARNTHNAIIWFPGNFGWSPANVGREYLRGVEARVQLTPAWGDVALWSTHYDSRLRTGDLEIPTPYTPRTAAGASASATVRGVSTSLVARVLGRRPFSAGPRNPAFELPAVGIVDAALSHPLPRAITPRGSDALVAWSLDNAFDIAWQSVRGFPSPGRTLAVSVSLRHSPTSP